ncbi:hypothetical protein EV182_004514, partial [Spiromyces aspiralis]
MTCVAARTATFIRLLVHGIHVCQKIYESWRTQVVVGYFMQTALVVMGIVSRLRVLFDTWLQELQGLYRILIDWVQHIP